MREQLKHFPATMTLVLCGASSVMSYAGSAWSYVDHAAISAGVSSQASLAYSAGHPIVAYRDWSNNFRLSVQRYDGAAWGYVGDPGLTQDSVNFVSLAAGPAAYHVAVSDAGNSNAVTVVRFRIPQVIFAYDFESGGTTAWSATVP